MKSKYSAEVIKASIEERENEMKEIEEKYVKANDLVSEREKLLRQLSEIKSDFLQLIHTFGRV